MWNLLWVVAVVCIVLWVLGFAFDVTLGGLIHVLLALAVISVLIRVITWGMGRKQSHS